MKRIIYLIAGCIISVSAMSQPLIIDRVVAVVGDFHILQSDVEQQYLQMKMSGHVRAIRCQM